MLLLRLAICALALTSCRSLPGTPASEPVELRQTIEELYDAFCFDAGGEPDWEAQRAIYLDGASFVSPARVGLRPEGVDEASFLSDFREFVLEGPYAQTGFHERIVGLRVDTFGGIAHAFVAFEGFRPGEGETVSRGLDSIQFVRDGGAWRLVSFTTQYEGPDLSMPGRFLVSPRD